MLKKKLTCLFIITILIFSIFLLKKKIDSIRNEHGLNIAKYTPSESVPILLLGGFRSIAIDLLWIRGMAKHQEKKYYETMAINNLIAKLQPDFSAVWSFQAWNMAYNIAHECKSYATKWKWIKAGIDFAKEGAVKNPASADILFELGYMYLHLFSSKTFKHADYCRKRLYEDFNENNFVEAVYWLKKVKQFDSKNYNKSAMQRVICHAWRKAALQAEKDGRLKDAVNYSTQSIDEWNAYLVDFPDDPLSKAKHFIPLIEQKREEIKKRLDNY